MGHGGIIGGRKDDRSSSDRGSEGMHAPIQTKNPKDSTQKVVNRISKTCGRLMKKLRCVQAIDASPWLCLRENTVISEMVEKNEGGTVVLAREHAESPTFNVEDVINSMQLFSDILMRPGMLPIQSLRQANASPYRDGVLQAVECAMDWAHEIYTECKTLKDYMETATVGVTPKTPLAALSRASLSTELRAPPACADLLPSFSQAASLPPSTPRPAQSIMKIHRGTSAAGGASSSPSAPGTSAQAPKPARKAADDDARPAVAKESSINSRPKASSQQSLVSIHEEQARMAIEEAKLKTLKSISANKNNAKDFSETLQRSLGEVASGKRRRRRFDEPWLSEAESDEENEDEGQQQDDKDRHTKKKRSKRDKDSSSEDPEKKKKKKRKDGHKVDDACHSHDDQHQLPPPSAAPPAAAPPAAPASVVAPPPPPSRSPLPAAAVPARSLFGSSQLASTLLAASEAAMTMPRPAAVPFVPPPPPPAAPADKDEASASIAQRLPGAAGDPDCQIVENGNNQNCNEPEMSEDCDGDDSDGSDDNDDDDRALFQEDCFGDISL